MKSIIGIGIFLLCAQYTLADNPFIGNCGSNRKRDDWTLGNYNKFRKKFAEENQITNMLEMDYSMELENDLRTNIKSCADVKNGPNFRIRDYAGSEDSENFLKNLFNLTEEINNPEVLHPLQTQTAYCEFTTICNTKIYGKDAKKAGKNEAEITFMVVYGPKGTFSKSDFEIGTTTTSEATTLSDVTEASASNIHKVSLNSILAYFAIAMMILSA